MRFYHYNKDVETRWEYLRAQLDLAYLRLCRDKRVVLNKVIWLVLGVLIGLIIGR